MFLVSVDNKGNHNNSAKSQSNLTYNGAIVHQAYAHFQEAQLQQFTIQRTNLHRERFSIDHKQ